ncbi:hypothetical protein N9C62_02095 [Luminiphilus sp.]|nr:hypothetical protein [Luminiphilus sp.]
MNDGLGGQGFSALDTNGSDLSSLSGEMREAIVNTEVVNGSD